MASNPITAAEVEALAERMRSARLRVSRSDGTWGPLVDELDAIAKTLRAHEALHVEPWKELRRERP